VPPQTPDWTPFDVLPRGRRTAKPRGIGSQDGVGDRLRAAAFAELQAREAFAWAADAFEDAPPRLRATWRTLADAEDRHLGWLVDRMAALGIDPAGRAVSDGLWHSLAGCTDAEVFCRYMADAEERGRRAGERIGRQLAGVDGITAAIFAKIAEEEVAHIAVAQRFFGPASPTDPLDC
jgi:uncharacterized ferritin-like protein (DUF455 family)